MNFSIITKLGINRFERSFGLSMLMIALFSLAFAFYVRAEKQVVKAHEQRHVSTLLGNELRQTSDDLTRMLRSYVTTGEPLYKSYYEEILAIRDGKQARPQNYHDSYWDNVLHSGKQGSSLTGDTVSLLELMRRAGLKEDEFAKLALATKYTDAVAARERLAIKIAETPTLDVEKARREAIFLVTNAEYRNAKMQIMLPISELRQMMDARTLVEVQGAETAARELRTLFIILGVVLTAVLWRAYQQLSFTLGTSVSHLKGHLEKLGRGDFSELILVPKKLEKSVLGLLGLAQGELARVESRRRAFEKRNHRLTQFYNLRSQCNQAIVRSHSEAELFQLICRDTVENAGISMAWIGIFDIAAKEIVPLAAEGDGAEYLKKKKFPLDSKDEDIAFNSVLVARDAKPQWCQEMPTPLPNAKWKASASIPLFKNSELYATLNLLADVPNAFDQEIQELLIELAMDLSFALNRFDLEAGRKRSRKLESLRSFILERISSAIPLEQFFLEVTNQIEIIIPNSKASIFLLDREGGHSRYGAVPNTPQCFDRTIDGQSIDGQTIALAPEDASFQHTEPSVSNLNGTPQISLDEDIALHPDVMNLQEFAGGADADPDRYAVKCWSKPIRGASQTVLGAFAIYHTASKKTEESHLALLEMAVNFLAIAIERNRTESNLHQLSQAVHQNPNIIIITDTQARIEYVNAAFIEKTGQTLTQVIGKQPSILQSGDAPLFTNEEIWDNLRNGENWRGELINRYADGLERIELAHVSPMRDVDGKITHFLSVQEDISEKKKIEERIRYLAHYDLLTGLPNRVLLEDRARLALVAAKRYASSVALIFFDLDHFKNINDSLGHNTGDALLIELAIRLQNCLREGDTISRLGGDEFILILPDIDEPGAKSVAEKLLYVVNQSYHIGEVDLTISASIGIAISPGDGEELEVLLKNADTAMYCAKKDGRNKYRFFTQEMQALSERHMDLVSALRYALDRGQLEVLYQPQIQIDGNTVIGVEALLRWKHPQLGAISSSEFIPVAEETGLILPIGEWVLRTAVQQIKEWHDKGWGPLCVAVNLSAIQFRYVDLPGTITNILKETRLAPEYLELELTEGAAMTDPAGAIAIMNDLHARGIRMSIDDFGTGYSSLSYLKKFKVYKLKIDQSFVRDIDIDSEDRAIVSAVISMAKSLGLQTIAEGVETIEQLEFLREQCCDEAQGYYFSKPLTAAQFETFMQKRVARQDLKPSTIEMAGS
jgi:diguanylate cyclase (GGDEF)-like protein/PAS domain S-box-containing protein